VITVRQVDEVGALLAAKAADVDGGQAAPLQPLLDDAAREVGGVGGCFGRVLGVGDQPAASLRRDDLPAREVTAQERAAVLARCRSEQRHEAELGDGNPHRRTRGSPTVSPVPAGPVTR
jgi:hypothetical protein